MLSCLSKRKILIKILTACQRYGVSSFSGVRTASGSTSSSNTSGALDLVLPKRHDVYESFSPIIDTKSTALLKGLACATVEDLSNGVRAIRIGNDAQFLGNDFIANDTIYERGFYPQLVSAIRCADLRVLLLGNSGTGNSTFQYYLLARYLKPTIFENAPLPGKIKFGSDAAPKVVIQHVRNSESKVWFLEQQVVHLVSKSGSDSVHALLRCFEPATTQYFYEPGQSRGIGPDVSDTLLSIPTLATIPPNRDSYNQFIKSASVVHMPLFTEGELVAIGRDMRTRPDFPHDELKDLYSDEAIQDRFKTFNGIIRHVLPQKQGRLNYVLSEQKNAFLCIDPAKFFSGGGSVERKTVSPYTAVSVVSPCLEGTDKNKKVYNFFESHLETATPVVDKILRDHFVDISLYERVSRMRTGRSREDSFRESPAIYETVIADHLRSATGVNWGQRICRSSNNSSSSSNSSNSAVISPLQLKLAKLSGGPAPAYADMAPMVLYISQLVNHDPFCDLMYKEARSGKLVCIQVSLEADGHRQVTKGAFKKFCQRMGWIDDEGEEKGKDPSKEHAALISYVYCPDPAVADKAKVTFAAGVGIDEYTIWHVDTDFSSGT